VKVRVMGKVGMEEGSVEEVVAVEVVATEVGLQVVGWAVEEEQVVVEGVG
jgi:hypothetical protein